MMELENSNKRNNRSPSQEEINNISALVNNSTDYNLLSSNFFNSSSN
jgi:hypothetical protein